MKGKRGTCPRGSIRRMLWASLIAVLVLVTGAPQLAAQPLNPPGFQALETQEEGNQEWSWQNPELAPNPYNNIHNDAWFTDTYTGVGPAGSHRVETTIISEFTFSDPTTGVSRQVSLGECAAHTYDSTGNLLTVCSGYPDLLTGVFYRSIVAISPDGELLAWTGFTAPFTSIIEAATNFGGAGYFYLDNQERIVMGMPDGHVVTWERQDSPLSDVDTWTAVRNVNITGSGGALPSELGDLYALVPAENGYTWFTTAEGGVGTIAPESCASDCVRWIDINDPDGDGVRTPQPDGNMQTISESHSVNSNSTFQQSDYFMFRFDMTDDGTPTIAWQEAYDRGTEVKPGQTSQGSGTSPSYFEMGGREFVTIMDNATTPHINVYRAETTLQEGEARLFASAAPFGDETQAADENSLIVYPGSTPDSMRIYAENNWGNTDFLAIAGPFARTQPGFGGIEVSLDGSVQVLPNNSEIKVPSIVSKGNIPSNALYTYEKRETGWYLTALNPSDPTQVEWSARVGWGAPKYNNWYAQLSQAPDGKSFNVGTLAGLAHITPVEGPSHPRICFAFLEPKDFIDVMRDLANWESGPTYYPEYLRAAFIAWEHDIELVATALQGGTEVAALPEHVLADLQAIDPVFADLLAAKDIFESVDYDVTLLSAEQKETLRALYDRHWKLIEAALIAYVLLCTDIDIHDLIDGDGGQNMRVMLYRSYLPTGEFDRVPLPELTVVKNGVETTLPTCPKFVDNSIWADLHTSSRGLIGVILELMIKHQLHKLGDTFPFCSWWTETTVENFNIAAPDENAAYWAVPLVAGDDVQIYVDGIYPDDRYMSLTLYNPSVNPYTYNEVNSWIPDYLIDPNPGSLNPWQVEADPGGSFRVTIKADPQNGEANVLPWFFTSAEGERGTMPAPCGDPGAMNLACPLDNMFISPPQDDQSSIFSNPNNRYMMSIFDPNKVYVIRGKKPTTPDGTHPVPWPSPEYQLRYFSICDIIYVRPYSAVEANGCAVDYEIPVDEDGWYTIVSSTEANRPSNATLENGFVWIHAAPFVRNFLVMRHMLPNEDFAQAAQNVPQDAAWTSAFAVMGEYYPVTTIVCTAPVFEIDPYKCWAPVEDGAPPFMGVGIY